MSTSSRHTILIRCDGSHAIGLGHVVRCLALAETLRRNNPVKIYFAVRSDALAIEMISARGFEVLTPRGTTGFDYESWLTGSLQSVDARTLILDSRDGLSAGEVRAIKRRGILVATIDDIEDKRRACDMAFYPPIPQVETMDWDGFNGKIYRGWEYVILRDEFGERHPRQEGETPRLLVSMGGSDPRNLTLRVVRLLIETGLNCDVDVLIGKGCRGKDDIRELCRGHRHVTLIEDASNVAEIMSRADIALASYGVTAYELAAMGVPAMYICLFTEQMESASVFVENGYALNLGEYTSVSDDQITSTLKEMIGAPATINKMKDKLSRLDMRNGAENISGIIINAINRQGMKEVKRWNQHEGEVLDSKNGYDIIRCKHCGFVHITPIPTQEELDLIYKEEYYTKEKPLYIDNMKKDFDWWQRVYDDWFDTFEQHLPCSRRSLLDVGSGTGYFLYQGKKRGWDVLGIEPSRQAAQYSRSELGLDIVEEFLTEDLAARLGKKFDVIHLSNVLEHIPDPKKLLTTATSLLKKDGVLCVVVPNDYNPIQITLNKVDSYEPWWVAPPHHINYFSFDSMRKLVESCGCSFLRQEATFPIDLFLLMGDNYIGNSDLGRECHTKRMNVEKKLAAAGYNDIKRKLFQSLAEIGIGREVVIFAQKKD